MSLSVTAIPWILMSVVIVASPQARAGKLNAIRGEVRGTDDDDDDDRGDPSRSDSRHHEHDDTYHDVDGDPLAAFYLGRALAYAVTSPFWGPYAALDRGYDSSFHYAPSPYHRGYPGALRHTERRPVDGAREWSLHLGAEGARLDPSIYQSALRLTLQTPGRIELSGTWRHLMEVLPDGRADALDLSDVGLSFRFAQSPRWQFRAGLGVQALTDVMRTDLGAFVRYGIDVFPADPVVLSFEGDLGNLGEAFVAHGRATAGVLIYRAEVYAGYEGTRIGDVGLGGPVLGLRLWL